MSELDVTIQHIGAQGDGVAETEAGALYVPLTLPGEKVRVETDDNRGVMRELLQASPERVDPPCPHFGTCGGCALQHMSDASYLEWKRGQVVQALAARGIEAPVAATIPSARNSRRRATFAAMRTRKQVRMGFYGRASHTIVSIGPCPVLAPAIERALPELAALVAPGLTRKGKASVSVTETRTGLDVDVSGGKADPDLALREKLGQAAADADIARLSWDGEIISERRAPLLDFSGIEVTLPPGAFLQATRDGEKALVDLVSAATGEAGSVADLFSGCGTFSLALARHHKVHAVEGAAPQCAALEQAVRRHGPAAALKPLGVERRDLARRPLSAAELMRFDAVVIDPPRAGAAAQCEELARSSVPVIASVSCNPATFARDARTLIDGGYRLEQVTPLDQFLWSPHIELVGIFRRE